MKVLKVVQEAADGLSSGKIATKAHLSGPRVRKAILELREADQIEMRGLRAGARYFPKGAVAA